MSHHSISSASAEQTERQLGLFSEPTTNREKAITWMDEHPHVVAIFERLALEKAALGKQFGINHLREVARWEWEYSYVGDFKFCNTHSPFVARRLLRLHPELTDWMECKLCQDELSTGQIELC